MSIAEATVAIREILGVWGHCCRCLPFHCIYSTVSSHRSDNTKRSDLIEASQLSLFLGVSSMPSLCRIGWHHTPVFRSLPVSARYVQLGKCLSFSRLVSSAVSWRQCYIYYYFAVFMCIQNLLQITHIKVSFLSLVFPCGWNLFIPWVRGRVLKVQDTV